MSPLKICIPSAEVFPFAKTGGLGDVSGALGKYLGLQGHDVRVFMPFYDIIDTQQIDLYPVDFVRNIPIQFEDYTISFSLLTGKMPGSSADMYFIHCPELYNRGSIYTGDWDEYLRFAFFSRAVIESCQRMGWSPDIMHANDWHTALIPLYLKTLYRWDDLFRHTKNVLTFHNLAYQGVFGSYVVERIGLGRYYRMFHQGDFSNDIVNFMKTGILYTDYMTSVSHTYAREIQHTSLGYGLQSYLRARSHNLVGIINGVDYQEWNPEVDKYIPFPYTPQDMSGKEKNKEHLLTTLDLPYSKSIPLFGIVSRLTGQKGFELLMEILFPILANNALQFVILGSGAGKYEDFFSAAQRHFPRQVCYYRGFNHELAHLIEAGADVFVMPSRFEPCGLNQIYSLKYGTVPIVHRTGGLADTVENWDYTTGHGTGFVFDHFTARGLQWAMGSAMETFRHRPSWERLQQNGMAQNYSWEKQSLEYVRLYHHLLDR